jgi:sn-glycerol 3-phosphate transport system substrate-binding protein
MVTALTMSNGGRYYNEDFAGEVYYDTPSMLGAVSFWNDLIQKHKVTPGGVVAGPAVTTSFLAGQSAMMLLSTGSLTHVLNNAKFPVEVGFVPKNVRNAVAIGGASLIIPAGVEGARRDAAWAMIKWMTAPEKSGWWSRATGYFAPNMAAYDTAEMKEYLAKRPQAQVAVNQLVHARPWFATFKTVPVRKALEDEVQAVLSGKKAPKEALAAAQKAADEILAPFNKETSLRNF